MEKTPPTPTPREAYQKVLAAAKYYAQSPSEDLDEEEIALKIKSLEDIIQLFENGTFEDLGDDDTARKIVAIAKQMIQEDTNRRTHNV